MLEREQRNGNPPTLSVAVWVGAATMENGMVVPQKIKNRITLWLSSPTPEHTPGQNCNSKRHMHSYIHSSAIDSGRDMSSGRWPDKEDTYIQWDSTHKKEGDNAICSSTDATRDDHSWWSKSERERQIPCDITYMWDLKYGTNECIYKTEIPALRLPRRRVRGRGMDREFRAGRSTLLSLE